MTLKGFLKTQLWVHPYGEVDLEREGGREEGGGRGERGEKVKGKYM